MDTPSPKTQPPGAAPSRPTGPRHILSLDGVRGLAILMVMVFHYRQPNPAPGWAFTAWDRLAGAGGNGVNLFFVLSGFLITGILWDAKQDDHYFRNFFARRLMRIFPLYYGVLLVALMVLPRLHPITDPKLAVTVQHQIWLWTYTSNFYESWSGRALPLFGHFWSLAVEEQFYLLWPLVVFRADWRTLAGICAACFVGAFIMRLSLLLAGADPALGVLRLTPCQLDSLATGAFLALLLRLPGAGSPSRWRGWAWRIFGASALMMTVVVLGYPELIAGHAVLVALCNSGWSVFFGAGLLLAVIEPPGALFRRGLETATLRTIGKYSYGLYVFHWPLGRLWVDQLGKWLERPHGSPLGQATVFQGVYFVLAAASSFLMAWLSWHLYEKHFLRLKRYFVPRWKAPFPLPVVTLSNP